MGHVNFDGEWTNYAKSKYVWVTDSENLIGRKVTHYEFILKKDRGEVVARFEMIFFLELHFEKPFNQQIF
jgi:hypothetical protein